MQLLNRITRPKSQKEISGSPLQCSASVPSLADMLRAHHLSIGRSKKNTKHLDHNEQPNQHFILQEISLEGVAIIQEVVEKSCGCSIWFCRKTETVQRCTSYGIISISGAIPVKLLGSHACTVARHIVLVPLLHSRRRCMILQRDAVVRNT